MQNDQPKLLTKAELRVAAMQELGAWIDAIETGGRQDWLAIAQMDVRAELATSPLAAVA
jgi:hypothetical protein